MVPAALRGNLPKLTGPQPCDADSVEGPITKGPIDYVQAVAERGGGSGPTRCAPLATRARQLAFDAPRAVAPDEAGVAEDSPAARHAHASRRRRPRHRDLLIGTNWDREKSARAKSPLDPPRGP